MEVVKKGRPQKGWTSKFTCTGHGNGGGGCGAVLLVSEGDLYQTSSSCRDETDYFTTFCCCECGVETDVKVPSSVILRGTRPPKPRLNDLCRHLS
jgi:hypothetical protein